ncbi:MAG: hypothetical protein DDT21_01846 [Syntrophomonadaceae bacterium]|nr:hypothetical protein [Bacillota bacterium]
MPNTLSKGQVLVGAISVGGTDLTGTELAMIDGITAGIVEASKAVVVDANRDIGIFRHMTVSGNIVTGTTILSEADLVKIDAITNGTQAAGKAVVADANVNTGISRITALHIGASGSETQVVATAAELNRAARVSTRVNTLVTTTTVTEATHENRLNTLNLLTGFVSTLPASTGGGAIYRFIVGIVNTSNSYIMRVANVSDIVQGSILQSADTGMAPLVWLTTGTSDTVTLNGTTTGGFTIGDWVEFQDIRLNVWAVHGMTTASGTKVTPFSATV